MTDLQLDQRLALPPGDLPTGFAWGAVASEDHDIARAAARGLSAYRFSVPWSLLCPAGRGPVDRSVVARYDRLVDALRGHGMEPAITLHRSDLPRRLREAGGWAARSTADRFADYAGLVGGLFGDRVTRWTTVDDPWRAAFSGPGPALTVAHHLNRAHGLAVRALRAVLPGYAGVGLGLHLSDVQPVTCTLADVDAARRIDGLRNRLFLEPVFRGRYPRDLLDDTASVTGWSFVAPGDAEAISVPIDRLDVEYTGPTTVYLMGARRRPGRRSPWVGSEHVGFIANRPTGHDAALAALLARVDRVYGPVSMSLTVPAGSRSAHVATAAAVIEAGVDLCGVYVRPAETG